MERGRRPASNMLRMRTTWAAVALVAAVAALGAIGAADARSQSGPIMTAKPSVSGTAAGGRRLTAPTGTWSGAGTIRYAFQWYRCDASGARCNPVHGATSATYMLVPRDVAKTIGLTVWASDGGGPTSG